MKLLRLAGLALTCLLALAQGGSAASLEKPKITIGVGGKPLLYYLPLTIAERRGYFKDAGLDVTINDFGGGSQALQALVGGSVDVVTGAYEHTIRMQAKGQDIRAVIELGRFPGIALGVRTALADTVKGPADLKGLKIGVTAPGSSTYMFAAYLMAKAGLTPRQAAFIGVGAGFSAVAAMEKGEIDAIANLDPVISKLDADGAIRIIADSRTEAETRAIFGGANPAAVVYLKESFIAANPATTQAVVDAFYKALRWLATATPDDIAATVPEAYWLGDKALYLRAVAASKAIYSQTGVLSPDGMRSAYGMLKAFDPELAKSDVDLSRTFDDGFVKKAAAGG